MPSSASPPPIPSPLRSSLACSLMAGTAWLAPSMPINASTHLRPASPPSFQAHRALASNSNPAPAGPLHCIHPSPSPPATHHPPPPLRPPHRNAGCRPAPPPGSLSWRWVGRKGARLLCHRRSSSPYLSIPATLLHIGAVPCRAVLDSVLACRSAVCGWRWMTSSRSFLSGGSESVALGPWLVGIPRGR